MIVLLIILILIITLLVTFLIMTAPNSDSKRAGMDNLHVNYAHRGLHGGDTPENSIPAFSLAAARGYGIELDVQLSSDGDVVVFHDYNLLRMCNDDVKLSALRGAELSWRRLGGTLYTIPSLEDVLSTVRGRVPILIELKGESSDTELCVAVNRIMGHYDGKYCVQSFNPYLLGWFKKNAPRTARGLLYTNLLKNPTDNKRNNFILTSMLSNIIARPDFISVDERYIDSFPVKLMTKFHKLTAFIWTVRDRDHFERYRSMGYSNIFEGFDPDEKKD